MHPKRFSVFLVIMIQIFGIPGSPTLASDKGGVINDPEVKAAIDVFDAWVQHRVHHEELPGVSVGLVYDQDLIWAKGYGHADLEKRAPATPSTAYRIASLTKLFTATAILQLRDAGKLQLDDPIAKHLSWFHLNDRHRESPVITVRHLLTHSSGLPRELDALYWDDMEFPDRKGFIKMFQESSTILAREKEFKYSNVAFAVLGFVVEAASGESYADYVTGHILKPLGMNSTSVTPTARLPALATGYKYRDPGVPRIAEPFTDLEAMVSAGNIASTVEDLAIFLSLQFREDDDNQIVRGSTLREMHRVQWLNRDWTYGRGFGWGVSRVDDQTRIGHGGYVPGHTSSISAAVSDRFGVIVLTNAGDGSPSKIAKQAWSFVAPAVRNAARIEEEPPKADPSWTKFVGVYEWFDADRMQVMLLNGELALVDPGSDDPWDDRIRLEFVENDSFKMIDQWQAGEIVTFELDRRGDVKRIIMPGYSLVRIATSRR